MKPKVSIIVPVYKVEPYLDRCVESILKQTYTDCEIILVDDGSPDKCPQMCDDFAKEYDSIKVIHKENGGLSSARLAGFEVAQGEFILFVDSDDHISEVMVEKLVRAIETENAELAMCSYSTVCGDRETVYRLPYQADVIQGREKVISNYILPLIGKEREGINIPGFVYIRLYKKELIQKEYFGSERKYFLEDHVFNLQYGDSVKTIAVVNEALYYYCVNRESLSNRYRKGKFEMYTNLHQFFISYIQKRNIQNTESRLDNFLLSALFSTIDNAVLAGSYSDYKKELHSIINDKTVRDMLKRSDVNKLSLMQKMILFLYRAKMFRTLYYMRKKRIQTVAA